MQTALPIASGLSSAEKLHGHLDAAGYKHIVLGLMFLPAPRQDEPRQTALQHQGSEGSAPTRGLY